MVEKMKLIDAEQFDVVCDANENREERSDDFIAGVLWMLNRIDEAHTVDAAPVRHGSWSETYDPDDGFMAKKYYCSACGDWNTYGKSHFCPNCGAKMDGEDNG